MSPSTENPAQIRNKRSEWVSLILDNIGVALDVTKDVAQIVDVPGVSLAVNLLGTIIETMEAVRDNKVAYQNLKDDAILLVAAVVRSCALHETPATWPPKELEVEISAIMKVLTETCTFVEGQNSRNIFKRIGQSKADVKEIDDRRKKMRNVLDSLQLGSAITVTSRLSEVILVQKATKNDALSAVQSTEKSKALEALYNHMAHGASHDSFAREDVPSCLEDTRSDEINDAIRWLRDAEHRRPVLWVRSPAGFGKTTLATTICKLAQESGHLGASYFWSRSDTRRPTTNDTFVATIAYQLCHLKLDSMFTDNVTHEIITNPAIFTKALSVQMERLVIAPLLADSISLKKPSPSAPPQAMLIVADGIDECNGPDNQKTVLNMFLTAIRTQGLRLRILLLSRNEHAIKQVLEPASSPSAGVVEIMDLKTDYSGVELYLTLEFDKIRSDLVTDCVIRAEKEWPSEDDFWELVERADGVFIFASVVMKYIASGDDDPPSMLEKVLSSPAFEGSEIAFSPLDRLYEHILNTIPPSAKTKAREILLCCVHCMEASIEVVHCLFRISPASTRIILRCLSAVINYDVLSDDSTPLTFFHASFRDYLTSRERLGDLVKTFWYHPLDAHAKLIHSYNEYYKSCNWSDISFRSVNAIEEPMTDIGHHLKCLLNFKDDANATGSVHSTQSILLSAMDPPVDLGHCVTDLDANQRIWWDNVAGCVDLVQTIIQHKDVLPQIYLEIVENFKSILHNGLRKLPSELHPYIKPLLEIYRHRLSYYPDHVLFSEAWDSLRRLQGFVIHISLSDDPATEKEMDLRLAIWLISHLLAGEKNESSYTILFDWFSIPVVLHDVLYHRGDFLNGNSPPELGIYITKLLAANALEPEFYSHAIAIKVRDSKFRFDLLRDLKDLCELYLTQDYDYDSDESEGTSTSYTF